MNIYNEFIKAIKSENVDAIKFFLNFKNFNPTYECNYAIRLAAFLGNNQSLITLLNDQRIDPSDVDNFAVIEAIKQENTETLQILLNDYRIKKEKINNELLIKLALDSKNLSKMSKNTHSNYAVISVGWIALHIFVFYTIDFFMDFFIIEVIFT